jgi:NitT/TauT family transport system substrate-binding protein
MRRWIAAFALIATLIAPGGFSSAQQPAPDRVRISLSPGNYAWLPIFLAVDRGYFAQQNLDVEITKYNGSATTQIPILARGDLDITPVVLGPAFFNQFSQGFDLTLIASVSQAHPGWEGATWLTVRQDLWDAKTIAKPADIKGKHVDVAAVGTPGDYLLHSLAAKAHLQYTDVNATYALRAPPDWFAAFRNKAVDVVNCVEPVCSVMQEQGIAHKWITYNDVMPWFQDAYFASSNAFLKAHPDVVRRFLIAALHGAQDVANSGGKWTPDLLNEVAKWSGTPLADVQKIPGPNYTGQLGTISLESMNRVQDMLIAAGALKSRVPDEKIIDTTQLYAARHALGIR